MNRNFLAIVFAASLIALISSCATKKEENTPSSSNTENAGDEKEWKAMDDFHMLMAEAFHPYKDSANLAPAKSGAAALADAANKWASSSLPEKVNNDDMKSKLNALKEGTATLAQVVASADDKVIGEQLTKVHDLFHAIQETWYGAAGSEHGEHH